MRVGVIGRSQMLYNSVKAVADAGYEIAFVATAKEAPEYTATAEDFRQLAKSLDVPFFRRLDLENEDSIRHASREIDIAITMNWPRIFTESVTSLFGKGIINAHGSLLPKYRGNACPNWAIINGETETGFTIHLVEPDALDTGDIVFQKSMPMTEHTYIGDVYQWLEDEIPAGFCSALNNLNAEGFSPRAQDEREAIRGYPRRPEDGRLDFSRAAYDLHRLVRASSYPFEGAYCHFERDVVVRVFRARVVELSTVSLCVPGQVLQLENGVPSVATGDGAIQFEEFEAVHPIHITRRSRFY
ncbi:methionyl-tRNA formyltransferase [Tepidicaulis sp.]|uniref:methionyl-tRNA formyltransferase n=1 Tax=Tepidicaulis sp. TaxID=1920809 RepID=UPI003B5A8417